MLYICDQAIRFENINVSIIEHMALVLCFAVHLHRENAVKVLNFIMGTEYRSYLISFILGLLNNAKQLDVRAKITNKEAIVKKRVEPVFEHSFRLLTDSISIVAQGFLKEVEEPNTRDGPSPEESAEVEYCRDRMLAGAIYFLGFSLMSQKKQLTEDVSLMTIMRGYNSVIKQHYVTIAMT